LNEITTGEMFAGCGGFRKGIEYATNLRGITARTVWANELDKHAAATYRYCWNDGSLQEGDIRKVDTSTIPNIDLLTAGFPCQSFSVAGRRKGFEDTRGTLFFEVARVLADKRPWSFLLENVKGLLSHDSGKTFQRILEVLTDLGYRDIQWCVVNSTCWVPQNRERVFISGHLGERSAGEIFPVPEDDAVSRENGGEMLPCLTASDYKGPSKQRAGLIVPGGGFSDNRICGDVAPTLMSCAKGSDGHQSGIGYKNPIVILQKTGTTTVTVHNNKTGTLVRGSGSGSPMDKIPIVLTQDRNTLREHETDGEVPALKERMGTGGNNVPIVEATGVNIPHRGAELRKDGVAATLKSTQSGGQRPTIAITENLSPENADASISNPRDGKYRVHREDEKKSEIQGLSFFDADSDYVDIVDNHPKNIIMPDSAMSLDQDGYLRLTGARPRDENGKPQLLPIGYRRFRRLTPTECERLQGFSDNHTAYGLYLTSTLPKKYRSSEKYTVRPISDTQRYRMTGNAVTTVVAAKIIGAMIDKCFIKAIADFENNK